MGKKKVKRRAPEREVRQPLSGRNGKVLLGAALAVCILPVVLGLRLWGRIPEQVPSGIAGAGGIEAVISRPWVVVGFPVLMCLLDLVAYWELLVLNRRKGPPGAAMRLLGRWGFPVMSAVFCGGMMLQAAGGGLTPAFLLPCLSGLLLLLLGSYLLDTPDDIPKVSAAPASAGHLCLAAGLLAIAGTMFLTAVP